MGPEKMKRHGPRERGESARSPHKRPRTITTSTLDVRCARCTRIFSKEGLKELNTPNGLAHHTHNECLVQKDAGCCLCQLILELVLLTLGDDGWGPDDRLIFRNKRSGVRSGSKSGIDVIEGRVGDMIEPVLIYPFAKHADPAASLIRRRPLRRNVQGVSIFSAAKKLIHSCRRPDGHQKCRYSRDTVLPTRVLDLGDPNKPYLPHNLRLKVNERETRGSYLALSYCWGKVDPNSNVKPVLLRRNTLQQLTARIDPETLPKSIQDAIVVTHKLGFQYLWVDALCIIQDKGEDKDHELSKMSNIYKNAAVTIAASIAKHSSDGFLQNNDEDDESTGYLPDCQLTFPMPNDQVGTTYLSVKPYEPHHPLDTRGWTLQESMLSSRMLLFSDHELLWQCNEVELQSVTGTAGGLEYLLPLEPLPWTVFDGDAETREPDFGAFDSEKVYLWKTVLRQYSERELTDPEDRLRAVTGITTELEKLWGDAHVYGHWKAWFVQLLAWYKPDLARVEKRHLKRAPSWSWVSVDGAIHYEEPMELEDAKVKIVTVAEVVLTCRILDCNEVEPDKRDSVHERPDFVDSAMTSELGDGKCKYLLLGKSTMNYDRDKGLGLLVILTAKRQYRRIGLVTFTDMAIWKGIEPRDITFEPRLQ